MQLAPFCPEEACEVPPDSPGRKKPVPEEDDLLRFVYAGDEDRGALERFFRSSVTSDPRFAEAEELLRHTHPQAREGPLESAATSELAPPAADHWQRRCTTFDVQGTDSFSSSYAELAW
jgi:hypothetical protein